MAITFYPMVALALRWVALALRCEKKRFDLASRAALPQAIAGWMRRIEGPPYFSKTWPPHWK